MASVTIKYSYEQVYTSVADKTITVQVLAGSDGGGGGVANHSELVLDDGTNPHGTTKADLGIAEIIHINIGTITVKNNTDWYSANTFGYNYYSHDKSYGVTADTSPTYDIPSIIVVEENIKLNRFILSGYGFIGKVFSFKLIKYNRSDLNNVATIMNDVSFQTTTYVFENYIDVVINAGLNDIVINKGEVLAMLWRAETTQNTQIKDCHIMIEYINV